MPSEVDRIASGVVVNEHPPKGSILIAIEALFPSENDARRALEKISEIVVSVSKAPRDRWPDKKEWGARLPHWLMETFRQYTKDELAEMERTKLWGEEWMLGSWLLSMQDRVWEWWSAEVVGNKVIIKLIIDGWPYSIKAFEHVLAAAGALQVNVKE